MSLTWGEMRPESTSFRMDTGPGPCISLGTMAFFQVMLIDFVLPTVEANGGINIWTGSPWLYIIDCEHML